MRLTYQYRIKPTPEQIALMDHWLELLRRHYNYALRQRLDWLYRTRCWADRCSLVAEPVGEIPERPTFYSQCADLKQTKALFPEYREMYHQIQNTNLQRLDKAWDRWMKPNASGKRSGKPRFKKPGELTSFTFSDVNSKNGVAFFRDGIFRANKIGCIPAVVDRPIPEGFTIKQAIICKKADGWYVSLSLEDKSIPDPVPMSLEAVKTRVGIDVGINHFLTTSEGKTVPNQRSYRKHKDHLARQQRKLERKQPGSKNHEKQQNRIARVHQRIARNRKDFHYKTAHHLVKQYDLIAVEDLEIQNMTRRCRPKQDGNGHHLPNGQAAKSGLNQAIQDAAWGGFIARLGEVAAKRGVHVVKVNPENTSQNCSGCGTKVPKSLSVRLHQCPACGLEMDRDENAAANILARVDQN